MPLLDELVNHFRGEAQRLADTPFAAEVAAGLRSLEGLVARRAQSAQAAFQQAETDVAEWLRARLHAGSASAAIEHELMLGVILVPRGTSAHACITRCG
jgi:hypothetical protein